MFIVIMAMLVTSMFVAAGYAAANGDLPMSGDSKDRKVTYAAAEAGLNFYSYHLNQDSDYWTKCDAVPAPNGTELNPVNQRLGRHRHRPAPLAQRAGLHGPVHGRAAARARLHAVHRGRPEEPRRPGHGHVPPALHRPAVADEQAAPQRRRDASAATAS